MTTREWWSQQFGVNLPMWIAFWVWVIITVGVVGRACVAPPEKGSVVPIYLGAGERWLAGDSLYQYIPGLDLYRNPPGVAAFFALPSILPPKFAAILWRLSCLSLYAHGVRRLVRDVLPPLSRWSQCGLWVAAGVFVVPAFNNGQINLLIVALAVCGVAASARGDWWQAAIWLGVCGYLKVYTHAIGLLICVLFPKTMSWRLTVVMLALVLIPFICQNPGYVLDRHREFLSASNTDDRSTANHYRTPRDWTIIAKELTGEPVPRIVSLAFSLVAAAEFAATVWACRRPHPQVCVVPFCLGILWITLFGPSTEVNTYCVVAPVIGLLVFALPNLDGPSKWLSWFGGASLLAVELRAAIGGGVEYDLAWLQPIGAAALTVAAVRWARNTSDRK